MFPPPVIPTDARQEQHPRDHPQAFPQQSALGDHRVTTPSAQGLLRARPENKRPRQAPGPPWHGVHPSPIHVAWPLVSYSDCSITAPIQKQEKETIKINLQSKLGQA